MSIDELEAEVLKLKPEARARLEERLLDSLEDLSDEENARVWAEEAERRSGERSPSRGGFSRRQVAACVNGGLVS